MRPIVTLLTDFGEQDTYVGQMKGAILSVAPQVTIVDLTHAIAPQDILGGAFELWRAWHPFPENTVHVAVVDPGVGTSRRIVAARICGHVFVLPDNGLLSLVLQDYPAEQVVEVTQREYWRTEVSTTFHGRDIMGPVGAHIASGVPLESLGAEIDPGDLMLLERKFLDVSWEQLPVQAHVFHVDRFGNLILSVRGQLATGKLVKLTSEHGVAVATTTRSYAERPEGELVMLVGSSGLWEVSVVGNSAAETLRLEVGSQLNLELVDN